MKKLIVVLLLLLAQTTLGDVYVDNSASYYISNWGTGAGLIGIPAPGVEWRFGNGQVGYDTTGGWNFVNHGTTVLATELDTLYVGIPQLGEGLATANQSSVVFSGLANTMLAINAGTVLDFGQEAFSVELWVQPTNNTSKYIGKKAGTTASTPGWNIGLDASNNTIVTLADGVDQVIITGTVTVAPGTWNHYVLVVDTAAATSNDEARVYRNGILIASGVTTNIESMASSTSKVIVGARGLSSNMMTGSMGLVRIWDGTPLTKAQVDSLYAHWPVGTASRPYPSIQSAIRQSGNLGRTTISVDSGTYKETINVLNDSLDIAGAYSNYNKRPLVYGGNLPAASALTIGSTNLGVLGFYNGYATESVAGSRCSITNFDICGYSTAQGVYLDSTVYGDLIAYNLIDSCLTGIRLQSDTWKDSCYNNTIDGAGLASSFGIRAALTDSFPPAAVWINNVIVNCVSGLRRTQGTLTANYNVLYGNTANYDSIRASDMGVTVLTTVFNNCANDLLVDPKFKNFAGDDYRPMNVALSKSGLSWRNARSLTPDRGALELILGGGYVSNPNLPFGIRNPKRFGIYLK